MRCTGPDLWEIESCQGEQAETWFSGSLGWAARRMFPPFILSSPLYLPIPFALTIHTYTRSTSHPNPPFLISAFNKIDIAAWGAEGYTVTSFGSRPHPYSHGEVNQTAYEEVGSLTWPVLVRWGPRPLPATGPVSPATMDTSGVIAKLTCARAKNAVGDSRVPWENGAGRSMMTMGSGGLALGVAAVVGWVVGW